ncbi:MAG TPA: DUF4382 domain-containing protein [Dehalococcoidia bacterium]|nr:DUF4382 domain-containing protein [Dehalococcoidia bacterium]
MSQDKDLDILLDKCIDRMNQGDSLEDCLAAYPEKAKELEPLLRAIWGVRDACSPIPTATAKSAMRQRLDAALIDADRRLRERPRKIRPLFSWPRVLAAVTAILVLALMGFGLRWMLAPEVAPVLAQANFRLLLSDQENAIGDFESLEVTITGIGMLRAGESGGWEKIELEESVVRDLTRLQGLNAQEIWGGIIPEGQYTQIFIYIEDAIGTLKSGETVDVVIPSGNLQISKPFVVGAGESVVNFVYDVTVVSAGNQYILLPQIDQSGPEQEFYEVGEGELTLWVVAPEPPTPVVPGDNITVLVTFQGDPVAGAQVKVNGLDIGNTGGEAGQEGRISFTVPYDEKLKVKAKITTELGELEGQLKIEFGDELDIEIVEGVVAPGQNIEVQVTLETLQGTTIPIPGAEVKVKGVGTFTTDAEGRTLPFPVPYDDELEIKAQKNKLKGELEIDLEEKFQKAELSIQIAEGELTPGANITILVTFQDNPVVGAQVKVKGVGVFLTNQDGQTIPFPVPYDDELEIKAQKNKLKGELEIDLEEKFQEAELEAESESEREQEPPEGEEEAEKEREGELDLEIEGEVAPGGTVTLLVTFAGEPVAGAEVRLDDEKIGATEQDGTISFTISADADELEIKVRKDKLKGELEFELQEEASEEGHKGQLENEVPEED